MTKNVPFFADQDTTRQSKAMSLTRVVCLEAVKLVRCQFAKIPHSTIANFF